MVPGSRAPRGVRIPLLTAASLAVFLLGLQAAVHWVPSFGPALANGLRAVLGTAAVTRIEELSADAEDVWNGLVRSRDPPRSLQEARPAQASTASAGTPLGAIANRSAPRRPKDVGPIDARFAARGDGRWSAVPDPARPDEPAILFAMMVHPDPKRSWSEAFVVAADLARVRLYAVPGTVEPEATSRAGRAYIRQGLVPREHQPPLLAAFNGGFRTEHGHHGMLVDGVTLVPPQDRLCTLVGFHDGRLAIGTWENLITEGLTLGPTSEVAFLRQAAPCMVEGGKLNPLLRDDETRNWGATLGGNVVIRRSAVGLDETRIFLYVGISNDTTAGAMARAMRHAGATDVAQLDVNWSYPKFLLFPPRVGGGRRAETLFKGFLFHEDEYVRRPSERDFFYLVRQDH